MRGKLAPRDNLCERTERPWLFSAARSRTGACVLEGGWRQRLGLNVAYCGKREWPLRPSTATQYACEFYSGVLGSFIAHRDWNWLLYGFELFERLTIFVFPRGKAICMTTMYYSCGRTWARKLNVSKKQKVVCFDDESAFVFKFLSHV